MQRLPFFFLLLTGFAFAQTADTLKQTYAKMVEANNKLDFDSIIDSTYPKLVEMAGRDALIAEMKRAFSDPNLKISFVKNDAVAEFGNIVETKDARFCVVRRETILRLAFKEKLIEAQAQSIQENIARGNPMRTVRFEPKENAFYSTGPDITIAVWDASTKQQWRFLSYDPSLEAILQSWFSQDIVEKLQLKPAPKPSVVTATTVTDARYNLTYKIAKSGKTWWMVENARAPLPEAVHFNDEAANDKIAGLAYKWENAPKACPPAWRLPNTTETLDQFGKSGPILYSGADKALRAKLGNPKDSELDKTFNSLVADGALGLAGFGQLKSVYEKSHNTMFWTSESENEPDGKKSGLALMMRRKNENMKESGVYFGPYRAYFYGFVRCVNSDLP